MAWVRRSRVAPEKASIQNALAADEQNLDLQLEVGHETQRELYNSHARRRFLEA